MENRRKAYDIWKLAGIIMLALGMACAVYFIFLMSILGGGVKFNYFFIIAAVILWGMGLVFIFAKGGLSRLPKWLLFVVEGIVLAGCIIFVAIEAVIIRCGNLKAAECDYVIVLGAKVNGSNPSLSLKARLDTAVEYLSQYENAKVIVSGGRGCDEDISEALCMYNYLTAAGIDKDRIIMEDESTSTKENLLYSMKLYDTDKCSTAVITSNFHVFRSVRLAKKLGYGEVYGNAAPSLWYLIPTNYVREFMAVIKDFLMGNL